MLNKIGENFNVARLPLLDTVMCFGFGLFGFNSVARSSSVLGPNPWYRGVAKVPPTRAA